MNYKMDERIIQGIEMTKAALEDRLKSRLYNEFYQQNKNKIGLTDAQGNPTVEYWTKAREYVGRERIKIE